jgi:sugar phosphate isomerase/epimerase
MFPANTKKEWEANLEDNLRALEEAVELNADCLVLVAGGLPKGSRDLAKARQQVEEGVAWLAERAIPAGIWLAIEPLHPMYCEDCSVVNTLSQALDLCDALGEGVGVVCDVYHLWWDPNLKSKLSRAGKSRIYAWLAETRHLFLDRGMMGDGVIDLPQICGWVEATGYAGFHEVKIFS